MKELDLDKPCENLDYMLSPVFDEKGTQVWNVNLLRAPYDNVTIRYNNVAVDGERGAMTFNFEIIEGESEEMSLENKLLQEFAGDVLGDILDAAIRNKTLTAQERDDGNQSTADDSTESTD